MPWHACTHAHVKIYRLTKCFSGWFIKIIQTFCKYPLNLVPYAIEILGSMKQMQHTDVDPLETSRNSTIKLFSKYLNTSIAFNRYQTRNEAR